MYTSAKFDLLIHDYGHWIAFEFKFLDALKVTPSMTLAFKELSLDHLFVIYPGGDRYPIHDTIMVMGLPHLSDIVTQYEQR